MSRIQVRYLGVLVFCFITGCFSTSVKWYKSGASASDFSQDKDACERALLGTGDSGMPKQIYTFEGCMERKGWQQIPSSSQ